MTTTKDWLEPHEFAQTPHFPSQHKGECVCGLPRENPLHTTPPSKGVETGEEWEKEFNRQFMPRTSILTSSLTAYAIECKAFIRDLLSRTRAEQEAATLKATLRIIQTLPRKRVVHPDDDIYSYINVHTIVVHLQEAIAKLTSKETGV